MLTRQLLTVVTVCFSLILGVASSAALAQNSQTSAGELFAQGMEQFEQGDLEAARESLRQVDHMQLPPNQRVRLFRTLQEIDRQSAEQVDAAQADAADESAEAVQSADDAADVAEEEVAEEEVEWIAPDTDELLREAGRMAGEDAAAAAQLYRQVIANEEATAEQRNQARANLAQLRRQTNRDLTVAREQIDLADQALDRGAYDEAIERLEQVQNSDVNLGWFDQQRVERQLALAQQQRQASQPAQPEAPAAVADAGAEAADEVAVEDQAQVEAVVEQPQRADVAEDADSVRGDLFQRARSLRQQELLAEARLAEEEGNIELAIRRYEAARELSPDNEEVGHRLQALRARQNQQLAPDDLISRERLDRQLRAQQAVADVRANLNTARARLEAGNYTAARDAVDRARLTLDREQRTLPPAQYRDLRDSAERIAIEVDEQRADEEARRQWLALQQEERDRREARIHAERERREQINELLTRAMEMRLEMRYDRALELVDRALAIDPTNVAAQAMKMGIEDGQILVGYREQRQNRERDIARQRALNLEASRPYADLVTYPHDWPELTVRRLAELDESMGETEANREVREALSQPVPVSFEANRLVSVIDFFREATGVNIFVNWGALELAGIDQDTPVSLQLSNVPAERALELVLQQASSDYEPVQYSVIDGIVTISTEADLRRTTDTRVYDIRDLLVQVPNFDNAPQFDLQSALDDDSGSGSGSGRGSGGSGSGRGGSSGGGLFGDSSDSRDDNEVERADLIAEIEELLRNTVGRIDDWDEYGGTVSSMREYNGNLIIRSTPDNHRSVVDLLTQLRETRAIQISVEARFLLVDQNFFENIGVDFDFAIDSPGGNFGPIRVGQDSMSITDAPVTDQTPTRFRPGGSPSLPTGFNNITGFDRSGRSLDLGVSYLDDLEVNLLVHATQANERSISLTAPRVTFFNGQRAYVIVAQQFAFVSDLEPIPDAAGFDQELSVVSSGVILDVEGTVSADRRYVTMTLQPSLAQLDEIRQLTQRALVEISTGSSDDDSVLVPIEATLEAPTLQITQVAATVSVPDGGTLLLGGQRLVDEVEIEAGVPVLSKVPFVNRLFTNTSTVKDERTLLILVKPSIIIQHEEEEKLYPGLLDDPASYDRRRR